MKYILCNGIYIQLLVASSFVYTTPSPRTPLALRAQKCDIAKSMQPTNRDIFPFFKVRSYDVFTLMIDPSPTCWGVSDLRSLPPHWPVT